MGCKAETRFHHTVGACHMPHNLPYTSHHSSEPPTRNHQAQQERQNSMQRPYPHDTKEEQQQLVCTRQQENEPSPEAHVYPQQALFLANHQPSSSLTQTPYSSAHAPHVPTNVSQHPTYPLEFLPQYSTPQNQHLTCSTQPRPTPPIPTNVTLSHPTMTPLQSHQRSQSQLPITFPPNFLQQPLHATSPPEPTANTPPHVAPPTHITCETTSHASIPQPDHLPPLVTSSPASLQNQLPYSPPSLPPMSPTPSHLTTNSLYNACQEVPLPPTPPSHNSLRPPNPFYNLICQHQMHEASSQRTISREQTWEGSPQNLAFNSPQSSSHSCDTLQSTSTPHSKIHQQQPNCNTYDVTTVYTVDYTVDYTAHRNTMECSVVPVDAGEGGANDTNQRFNPLSLSTNSFLNWENALAREQSWWQRTKTACFLACWNTKGVGRVFRFCIGRTGRLEGLEKCLWVANVILGVVVLALMIALFIVD